MKWVVHRSQPHDIYIGRPSKWGNPFIIGRDGTRAEVVQKHKIWLPEQEDLMECIERELRGKILGCWCREGQACHGHYLAQLANRPKNRLFGK